MSKISWKVILPVLAVILLAAGWVYITQRNAARQKISAFGKYQGYTEPVYDGSQRTSAYLTLSDGTRLAYDLILPTQKGIDANKPLPVLFKYTPYGRAWTIFDENGAFLLKGMPGVDWTLEAMARARLALMGDKGRILDPLSRDEWLEGMVKHGYAVLSVDRPGTGASFASPTPGSMETAAKFENEIIDWAAAQPWCDGNIGMYGDSQQAMVQMAAASTGNPHLKAIMPAATDIDIYQSVEYPGGVFNLAFAELYKTVPYLDRLATPVDRDPDGALLAQAQESRKSGISIQSAIDYALQCPYHDSVTADGVDPWGSMNLYPFVGRINQARTPVYLTVGWYDIFTADMFYWYQNLSTPKRLTVRPTDHSQVSGKQPDLDYGAEARRWFDYWLKGIDNGIMAEAPIHYYVQSGPGKGTWQTSSQWPLAAQATTRYYFGEGKTGSATSINDGALLAASPTGAAAADAYTVDYTTTTGTKSRWGAVESAHVYPDMSANDRKALTYTTPVLENPVEITGHPVIHLWLSTAAPDLDAFVYLELVDKSGHSTYITEGNLRATQRKLGQAPYANLGLPYQTHNQGDVAAVPAETPFEMIFSLLPTSYQFPAGSRIRITITFADAGNFATPIITPAPALKLLRDAAHPSYIEMPVIGED